jgi:hypothetical protein
MAVIERSIPREADWTWTADCMISSGDGLNSCDFCHVERQLKKHVRLAVSGLSKISRQEFGQL